MGFAKFLGRMACWRTRHELSDISSAYRDDLLTIGKTLGFGCLPYEFWFRNARREPACSASESAFRKWRMISAAIPGEARTALDIGCNNGFFSLHLAQSGRFTIGLEMDEHLVRLAQVAALHTHTSWVSFGCATLAPDNVHLLPTVDVTLVLSVMHRWVQAHGEAQAREMLRQVWVRSAMGMFYEMPVPCESPKWRSLLAFMGSSPEACRAYLSTLLASLPEARVARLGETRTPFCAEVEHRDLYWIGRHA